MATRGSENCLTFLFEHWGGGSTDTDLQKPDNFVHGTAIDTLSTADFWKSSYEPGISRSIGTFF